MIVCRVDALLWQYIKEGEMSRRILCGLLLCLVCPILALAQASETPSAASPGLAIETQLCRSVVDRQPIDPGESFPADVGQVFLWTKVTGTTDTIVIKHVWFYGDQEMATVELPVRSSFWRTWSSKIILPQWVGDWQVKVVDAEGNIFKSVSFTITPAAAPEPEPEETVPEEEESDTMGQG